MSRLLSTRWSHVLDYENGLKQASLAGGVTVSYAYDALGRRIQPSTSDDSMKFVYDGQDVVRDLNDDGSMATEYLNDPGIDDKIRQTYGNGALYFTTDHLGSTRAFTNASGNVISNLSYDSFGNSTGSSLTRYTYTGREFDSDTGL